MKPFHAQSYYELLEITVSAPAEEVRAAYERLAQQYGEDQVALYGLVDSGSASQLRARLLEAMEILTDEDLRGEYDRELGLPPRASAPRRDDDEDDDDEPPAQMAMNDLLQLADRAVHSTHPRVAFEYVGEAKVNSVHFTPRETPAVLPPAVEASTAARASAPVAASSEPKTGSDPSGAPGSGGLEGPAEQPSSAAEHSPQSGAPAAALQAGPQRPSPPAVAPFAPGQLGPAPSAPPPLAHALASADAEPPSSQPGSSGPPGAFSEAGEGDRPSAPRAPVAPPSSPHVLAGEPARESSPRPVPPVAAALVPVPRPSPAIAPLMSQEAAIGLAESQLVRVSMVAQANREARAAESAPRPRGPELPPDAEYNGELLRMVRQAAGLSLQQLADKTRIGARHLENVEADRYAALPAPVYLRGILMNLSRELGLDGLKVSKSYLSLVERAKSKG